jgi:hypothetical protein
MSGRAGQAKLTGRTVHAEQDRQNRTVSKGLQNKLARTGLPGQECLNRAARTGLLRQDSQSRADRIGQPGKDTRNRTPRSGKQEYSRTSSKG